MGKAGRTSDRKVRDGVKAIAVRRALIGPAKGAAPAVGAPMERPRTKNAVVARGSA